MARKVILDVDPGIDDAVALCIALFASELDVTAVTAVGGNVSPAIATRNLQSLLYYLDPPKMPRIGAATPPDYGLPIVGRFPSRVDELRDAQLKPVELRTPHPAEKLILDEVRSAPHDVTVIALGPLTNLARAFQLDPELPSMLHQLIIAGGTVVAPGNITPAAEFNFYCDPQAARAVLASPAATTLITLDATNRLSLTYGMLHELPGEETRVGALLHRILPAKFRAYRQQLGQEIIHLHDTVALMAALMPEIFVCKDLSGDVETAGELTAGAVVFDRRPIPGWRNNLVEVAVDMDPKPVSDAILTRLRAAAEAE